MARAYCTLIAGVVHVQLCRFLLVVVGSDEVDVSDLTTVALVQHSHTLTVVVVPHFNPPILTTRHYSVCGGVIQCSVGVNIIARSAQLIEERV